jgi:hypothetical protein
MDLSSERVATLLSQTTVADATGTDFDVTSMATARLTIIPVSYTGTITFYASADGTNFDVIRGYKQGTTTVATSLAPSGSSTNTIWEFPVAGLKKLRVITSGSSSGTSINIVGRASPIPSNEPIGVTLSSAVLAAGTAVIGSAMIQSVSGTALGADVSNSELKVSNYVKSSAAGDTALTLGQTTMAASLPVTMASDQGAIKTIGTSVYPSGATPLTAASGNVAAATAAATLAATSGKTTYITGFAITGTGATGALAVSVTVTGVITGTLTYTYAAAAGAAVENTPLIVNFPHPIPASATNTTIVVSCPTLGTGNTNNTAVAYGFQL